MRILALDAGFNLGWGALGGGREPASGCRQLDGSSMLLGRLMRSADTQVRNLILAQKPDLIGMASLFVGSVMRKDERTGKWVRVPISPDSIGPLFAIKAKIEEVCDELKIRCVEVDEPECRRAFLGNVPRKSKDIKAAVDRACRTRGWYTINNHAADALCVASRLVEIFAPDQAHEMTPLFQAQGKKK